jgi:hypothetical protein
MFGGELGLGAVCGGVELKLFEFHVRDTQPILHLPACDSSQKSLLGKPDE